MSRSHTANLYPGKLWPGIRRRLPPGGAVLVAVSGGADSVGLLHLVLPGEAERNRIKIGYVHHGTGEHADSAEAFVRKLAESLCLKYDMRHISPDERSVKVRGFEAAARTLRYQALEQMAEHNGCSLVLTGHTRDDQAESVLIYLLRGSGAGGLAATRERRGLFYRPLLRIGHEEILAFLATEKIDHLEDPSNEDLRFTRNKIRHLLKPLIVREFGTGAWRNLAWSASHLSEIDEVLREQAADAYEELIQGRTSRWIMLDKRGLSEYLKVLRVNILRLAYAYSLGEDSAGAPLSRQRLNELSQLPYRPEGTVIHLPRGVAVRVNDRGLIFDGTAGELPVTWTMPGSIRLSDGTRLDAEERSRGDFSGISERPGRVEYVDADRISPVVKVRPWREGDRFEPLGRPGHMVKVVRALSGSRRPIGPLWVAEAQGTIFYVIGQRISHFCRVRPESKRLWRLSCNPPDSFFPLREQ